MPIILLARFAIIAITAVAMAVLDFYFVFRDYITVGGHVPSQSPDVPPEFVLFVLVYWAFVSFVGYRSLVATIAWGLLSPFIFAALYFGPFTGHWPFVAIFAAWYVAFPVGLISGAVVGLVLQWRREPAL
jgi:hypothetical protein